MDAWHTAGLANSPAPCPAPWKGTPLSSPGVDGQTPLVVAFHGEGHSPPPVRKRAWAHPGCITHRGCVSHLPGLQFPHLLVGTIPLTLWILVGKQEMGCMEWLKKAPGLSTRCAEPAFESEAFASKVYGVFSFSHRGPGRSQSEGPDWESQ